VILYLYSTNNPPIREKHCIQHETNKFHFQYPREICIAQSNDATLVQTSPKSVVLIGTYTKCKMPEKGDLLKLLYSSYEDIVI
jgi:hypothetical protein